MKKVFAMILAISVMPAMVSANTEITIRINGENIVFDEQPVIESDHVLIPMRGLFEGLGADVEWSEADRSVRAVKNDTRITLTIDDDNMLIEKLMYENKFCSAGNMKLDAPARLIDGITYIPLRAAAYALDCSVDWNGENRIVSVYSEDHPVGEIDSRKLIDYGIISDEDMDRDKYITNIEALKAIYMVINGGMRRIKLDEWYRGETLTHLDYLDDETKEMLLVLDGGRSPVINRDELQLLEPEAILSEYSALAYLTRLIGSRYDCMGDTEEAAFTEAVQTYDRAFEKGLIYDRDMSHMNEAIERDTFYALLAKAIYIPFKRGGGGQETYSYLKELENRSSAGISNQEILTGIKTKWNDDLSLTVEIPDEYKELVLSLECVTASGSVINSVRPITKNIFSPNSTAGMLAVASDLGDASLRGLLAAAGKTMYFDIPMPPTELVSNENDMIPGKYMYYPSDASKSCFSLAGTNKFKQGAYYLITSYKGEYRKPEYDIKSTVFIKSDTNSPSLSCKNSAILRPPFSDIHIREVFLDYTEQGGIKVQITPESSAAFEIVMQ